MANNARCKNNLPVLKKLFRYNSITFVDSPIIELNEFDVVINDKDYGKRIVDSSGRIGIGRELTNKIGDKIIKFKLENSTLFLSF